MEDDSLPFYPVYDATLAAICAFIGECHGFEYYLAEHEFRWLLCENHHNWMIGVGRIIEESLRGYVV